MYRKLLWLVFVLSSPLVSGCGDSWEDMDLCKDDWDGCAENIASQMEQYCN